MLCQCIWWRHYTANTNGRTNPHSEAIFVKILSSAHPELARNKTHGSPLSYADGVIAISRNDAAALINKAEENAKADHAKVLKASSGTASRRWVNDALTKTNVEIIDDIYM